MFKSVIYHALAASIALFPVAAATAKSSVDPLSSWVLQVNHQLDEKAEGPISNVSGSAKIQFRRGDDGHATDIVVLGGQRAIAIAAARTVRRLKNLPPLPVGFFSTQRITLDFLVGRPDDMPDFANAKARMLASAARSNTELASRATTTQVASVESH